MLAIGFLLLIAPPGKSLGRLPNLLFTLLFVVSLTAFLPWRWFPVPQWRIDLANLGARFPSTRSPQPWLSLQWVCLLFLGLVWAYYVAGFEWRRRLREKACFIYAIAIVCLSAVLIVAFITKQRVPFWPQGQEFGFFPNRNQTSNVLGLGGVMIYAMGLQSLHENRRYWWGWPVSLVVVCWALIVNYSRAGIILFFFGSLALHFYWWRSARDQQRPLLAVSGLVLLIALFVINGGATLMRFGHETVGFLSPEESLRWPIYKDSSRLLSNLSFLGVGLGNFRPIFAFNRLDSASENEIAHPESDWFWSAIDFGWLGPLIVLTLVWWWLRQCRPFDRGSLRLLRVAALICGCGFFLHGFFDVSGHRPGALWPALFLASIAIHPQIQFTDARWVPILFRSLGLFFLIIGTWWMASLFGVRTPPTSATVEQLRSEVTGALARNDYASTSRLADRGLQIVPLDWIFYYNRGVAKVVSSDSHDAGLHDFGAANYLNPLWPDLYFHQGEVWLAVGEMDFALDVWTEALRHAHESGPWLYERMLSLSKSEPLMRDRLRNLAQTNNTYLLIFLREAQPFEFQIEATRLIGEDRQLSSFSPAELDQLFSVWYNKGDELALADLLQTHPEWQKIGWRTLARVYADYHDYRQAYETVAKFDPPPAFPKTNLNEPLETLAARFKLDRTDIGNGLALYQAQIAQGRNDDALATLRKMSAAEGSPKNLSYLEAELLAQNGRWKEAWEAAARFEFGSR
jgi:tetratricopeptide (TPR) repeat protein